MLFEEPDIHYSGHLLAGVDEAGRGPLAGDVVAAAVILDSNNSIEGFAAELVGFQANQHATFESQLTFETNFRDTLIQTYRDESGVNTDEELAKLIEPEAAFAASARVLQTVQQSLDELVNIIR